MQQNENLPFQGIWTVQKERFDRVKWVKHGGKRELDFSGDIDRIARKVSPGKIIKHAAKRELRFLGDIDCIERKV